MKRNTQGGKNYKKGKKFQESTNVSSKNMMPMADKPELLYAQVISKLGGNRLSINCSDGVLRQAIIPGSFYKRVWINKDDILLVQLDALQNSETLSKLNKLHNSQTYVIYKYTNSEINILKEHKYIDFDTNTNDQTIGSKSNIVFTSDLNIKTHYNKNMNNSNYSSSSEDDYETNSETNSENIIKLNINKLNTNKLNTNNIDIDII
jgi:translation initiation factor 1A